MSYYDCCNDNGRFVDGTVRCGTITVESIDNEADRRRSKCMCVCEKNRNFLISTSKNLHSGLEFKRSDSSFNQCHNGADYSDDTVDFNGVGTDTIGIVLIEL